MQIQPNYEITVKQFLFYKRIVIKPLLGSKKNSDQSRLPHLKLFDSSISETKNWQDLLLRECPVIEECTLIMHEAITKNGQHIHILELVDICVTKKYRSKGVGSQLITILENIAISNHVNFIFGELQPDRENEPLGRRKKFFKEHGFEMWHDDQGRLSGWYIKKCI